MFLRQWIWCISFSLWWFSFWPMESLSKLSCTQTSVHPGLWHLVSSSGLIFKLMESSLFKLQTLVGILFFRAHPGVDLSIKTHSVEFSSISPWLRYFLFIRYHYHFHYHYYVIIITITIIIIIMSQYETFECCPHYE